ncbi:hypothetical protein HG530_006114 [Fusarium avenaceum]|nr:hypothetical protein HG530_006114 [Fusarium avenaceum]
MKTLCNSCSNLDFKGLAHNGSNEWLQEPSQAGKFGFSESVVEVMNVNIDVAQGNDLFHAILADFDVEGDIHTTLIKMESRDTFVDHSEKA